MLQPLGRWLLAIGAVGSGWHAASRGTEQGIRQSLQPGRLDTIYPGLLSSQARTSRQAGEVSQSFITMVVLLLTGQARRFVPHLLHTNWIKHDTAPTLPHRHQRQLQGTIRLGLFLEIHPDTQHGRQCLRRERFRGGRSIDRVSPNLCNSSPSRREHASLVRETTATTVVDGHDNTTQPLASNICIQKYIQTMVT